MLLSNQTLNMNTMGEVTMVVRGNIVAFALWAHAALSVECNYCMYVCMYSCMFYTRVYGFVLNM